ATYALLGYALYEFFRGLTEGAEVPARAGERNRESGQAGQRGQSQRARGTGQRITGQGRGEAVQTHDPDGGASPHVVGRGIVH
ncbi:MAG: hypothetical protein JWL69_3947, partial [Phycisphaerales bacterium]|nr:hypothetical protein [Phycisphaerales bacterium]